MWAVERYQNGEDAQSICASLGKSLRWLYKWVARADGEGEWFEERSRRPNRLRGATPELTERLVLATRAALDEEGSFCGAQAIIWDMEERQIAAPSIATVNRILKKNGVFDKPSSRYARKGKKYPAPVAIAPNDVHQNDFVGPRFLHGGTRFYSFNATDVVTSRSAAIPIPDRTSQSVVNAIWGTWCSLGIPTFFQLDNELVFWGSRRHPRGLGQVLRLCLHQGVQPLFIPPAEPWRNGVIEKSNDHWQQKFLRRSTFENFQQLLPAARAFDAKRNSRWRYQKNRGLTPNDALVHAKTQLRFPNHPIPPSLPLSKPTSGRYHLIRFVRSDRRIDLFGERYILPRDTTYEYVTATVDVALEELLIAIDGEVRCSFDYRLR
jgi:hypothetical protein